MSDGDAGRSTFRRFPWAPAVLCAASLAMAAWTWMRYSYCWDISVNDLPTPPRAVDLRGVRSAGFNSPAELKELSRRAWQETVGDHWLRDRYVRVKGRVMSVPVPPLLIGLAGAQMQSYDMVDVSDGVGTARAQVPPARVSPYRIGEYVAFRGRTFLKDMYWWISDPDFGPLWLDSTAGRWHPASVGGLVVGAMGAFVFALYLRSWLRARRAANGSCRE